MLGNSGKQTLEGKIALVAGATRGAGRGIAVALGAAGATVYCTGRSTRKKGATPGRPETIEETAEMVTAAGGRGIAVRVDHTIPGEVKKLVATIKRRHKGLDILVNDVWGGDALTQFGKGFWSANPRKRFANAQAGRAFPHHHGAFCGTADVRATGHSYF
jgi:NAD(P)-dependent dehydrogenase (short-subunit alcohol dehydrogenase family)